MIQSNNPRAAFKTGTSTVGICFKNGVVVEVLTTVRRWVTSWRTRTCRSSSRSGTTSHSPRQGSSTAQSLARTLTAEVNLFVLKRKQNMTVKGEMDIDRVTSSRVAHTGSNSLIVGADADGPAVYSIDSAGGSIPDVYCATGSGSPYMYGVLEDGFKENMTEKAALQLAARALLASGQRDAASGNGMDLAVITHAGGYAQLTPADVDALIASI